MSDLAPELERTLRLYADAAVAAALGLLDRGASLDDLVAILGNTDEGLSVTVGPRTELLAKVPELAGMLRDEPVPSGYLQWVVFLDTQVACGAFRVVPWTRAEA